MTKTLRLDILAAFSVGLFTLGCASTTPRAAVPEKRPLGSQFPAPAEESDRPAAEETPSLDVSGSTLTLQQALAASLLQNPGLVSFSTEIRAAEARTLQARALPNPSLGLEVEEYDRDGAGFDSAETVIAIGQLFELGGKRRERILAAGAAAELAGWDYENKRLEVLTETARRFVDVLAARRRVEVSAGRSALGEQTLTAVRARERAGKEPPLRVMKSEADLKLARLGEQEAKNRLAAARTRLAVMWGEERTTFGEVTGAFDRIPATLPSLATLRANLAQNPDLARWDAELRMRRAILDGEKAARVPDLELFVGYQQYEEDGTDALTFGVGTELPVFNRNQGNVRSALLAIERTETERRAAELALVADLIQEHTNLKAAHQRIGTLREDVVPAMTHAYEAAHEGYEQGKFGFLDVLDAQRGLFDAQEGLVEALAAHHRHGSRFKELRAHQSTRL